MLNLTKSITARRIASNTIYQLVGKAVTMTVTVLITVIVAREYGRDAYGQFNIMQAFPALFFVIADFGFNAIATRDLSADWKKAASYLANILSMRLVLSALLIALSGIALIFFPYSSSLRFGVQIGLLLILTQAIFTTTNIIFQVKLRYDLSTIGLVAGYALILGFSLLATSQRWNVMWINFSYVLGGVVSFLMNAYFVKRLGVEIGLQFDKKLWKYLIRESLPLGLMFVFSQINSKADSILLSVLPQPESLHLSNTESVAVYGLAYKVFDVSLVLPTFFMNSVYPVLVRHMSEGPARLKGTFKNAVAALFSIGVLVGVVGYFAAPMVIDFLGGSQFASSVSVLRILLGGMVVFYLTQPVSWLIVTLGKQRYLPYIYLIGALFSFSMNVLLIPRYSFFASSYLTWVSELLILILLVSAALKAWKLKYAKN